MEKDKSGAGNTYVVKPDDAFSITKSENMTIQENGNLAEGNKISVRESKSHSDTGLHEMGHALGLVNSSWGLITSSQSNENHHRALDRSDIRDIIKYPLKNQVNWEYNNNHKKVYSGAGTVQNPTNNSNILLLKGKVK